SVRKNRIRFHAICDALSALFGGVSAGPTFFRVFLDRQRVDDIKLATCRNISPLKIFRLRWVTIPWYEESHEYFFPAQPVLRARPVVAWLRGWDARANTDATAACSRSGCED